MNYNPHANCTANQTAAALPPYQEQNFRSSPAYSFENGRNIEFAKNYGNQQLRDYSYFRSFYSRPSAYMSCEISKYFDTIDYPGSFLYDEYPDKRIFQYHVDKIMEQISAPPEELWIQPVVELLLVQEFLYRRSRKIDK